MTVPYFFINKNNISDNKAVLVSDDFKHLIRVLRAHAGDSVELSDNEGGRYFGHIGRTGIDIAEVIIKRKINVIKRIPEITLFQCILKKDSMEYAIQKTVEIGIDCIIPVYSERTVPDPDIRKIERRISRWQQIALNASMQCKRSFICNIYPPVKLKSIVPSDYDIFFMTSERADESNEKRSISGDLNFTSGDLYCTHEIKNNISRVEEIFRDNNLGESKKIAYIIGPEGGFEEKEKKYLEAGKAVGINFGENILRSETASVYFLSIIDFLIKLYRKQ